MARIYSSSNRIRFTDIPENYAIPRGFRAKQSEVHSAVIMYVYEHYKDTKKYRKQVVDALNCLTYCILQSDPPPVEWVSTDPLNTMPEMDLDMIEQAVGDYYLTPEAIEWNVAPTEFDTSVEIVSTSASAASTKPVKPIASKSTTPVKSAKESKPKVSKQLKQSSDFIALTPTKKEDLYIQPPKCPRFDISKVWMSATVGNDRLVIYTTLPEIPKCQNDISVTTNLDMMTESELMALYPNQVIHTRSPKMYEKVDGLDYDEDLGCIIPILEFTKEQLIDNLIRFPHLYKLRKYNEEGQPNKFFTSIEIHGELIPIDQVWDTLPESKIIPRDPEFIKEYVIRRYILEEENGVTHKYRMCGSLGPYLTLFMPCTKYIEKGYTDTLSIVKQCVMSRVSYKQTRNPILQRIEANV